LVPDKYSFALVRKFIDSRCKEGEDVESWANEVQAQCSEPKLLSFDLDALCVYVMLNGLPEQFESFVDGVWTASETQASRMFKFLSSGSMQAGQLNHTNDKALAAKTNGIDLNGSETDLKAFYAGLKHKKKKKKKKKRRRMRGRGWLKGKGRR